jgi:hypothetical protein
LLLRSNVDELQVSPWLNLLGLLIHFNLLCAVQRKKHPLETGDDDSEEEEDGRNTGLSKCDRGWLTLDLHLSQRGRCSSFPFLPVGSNSAVGWADKLIRRR